MVFQHGLGGDEAQVAEVFPDDAGLRRLTLDCRGQGRSELGPPEHLSIATFAADTLAFAGQQGVERWAVGGISMGAAIALRLAMAAPAGIRALILCRPAWLWEIAPANMRPFAEIANLLGRHEPGAGLEVFNASATARRLAVEAPDNLTSLRGFFSRPDPKATAALLEAITRDGPGVSERQARNLGLPALVIGNRIDAIHPLAYARALADVIPGARLVEVTPKATSRARHAAEVRAAIAEFLATLGPDGGAT